MNKASILMPTSPLNEHPSTRIIDKTIEHIRSYEELRDMEIFLMFDGVAPELTQYTERYEEYKRVCMDKSNFDPKWRKVIPIVFDQHTWSANMIRKSLNEFVRTPYVICTDHDMYPIGEIPWAKLFSCLELPEVYNIRLNCWDRIIPEHQYLFGQVQDVNGVPLTKTLQWSDQLHVCRTDWLKGIINKYIGRESKIYLEGIMYQVVYNRSWAAWNEYGLWLYTPPGNTRRTEYDNGRMRDPKPAVFIRYDGERPEGAAYPT